MMFEALGLMLVCMMFEAGVTGFAVTLDMLIDLAPACDDFTVGMITGLPAALIVFTMAPRITGID